MFTRLTLVIAGLLLAMPASAQQINACISDKGKLSKVTVGSVPDCGDKIPISWNVQGLPGTNGTNGTDGAPGTNGINGTNGLNGTNGAKGDPGLNGAPGTNGTNGTNGINGTDGAKGADGAPGAKGDPGLPGDAIQWQLVTHKPGGSDTDGIITTAEWHECATELGGRPANTKDLMTLAWDPSIASPEGWINIYVVHGNPLADISGHQADNLGQLKCGIWSSSRNVDNGMFAAGGATTTRHCDQQHPIVCAVPVPPPAGP